MNPATLADLFNRVNCGISKQYPAETRYREVKPHWWSRKMVKEPYEFTPEPEHYHLEEALKAITALGESGSSAALEFLEKLYTPDIDYDSERYFVSGGSEPRDDDWKYQVTISVVYPNAAGELYDSLKYIVHTDDYYEDDSDADPYQEDYFTKLKQGELPPPENEKSHLEIQAAIAELKKTLAS